MDRENKVLGLIGISAKAGKIAFGSESVIETIEKNKAKLVIVASDSSDKTKENIAFKCEKNNIPIVTFGSIDKLSHAIGKDNKAVICIKDKNLSEEIYKIICGGEAIG